MNDRLKGGLAVFIAYVLWGAMPVYWRTLRSLPATEILCYRIIWSFAFLAALLLVQHKAGAVLAALRGNRSLLRLLAASGLLITLNWYLYIWAVNRGMVLSVSLGYFINPLMSILLGVALFRERLRPLQRTAVLIAAAGVCVEIVGLRRLPAISLAVAASFAAYGALRKKTAVEPAGGLFAETAMTAPFALLWLLFSQRAGAWSFPHSLRLDLLLAGAGVLSSLALLLFTWGARRIRLSTVGLIQYTSPIMTFFLAVFIYGEDCPPLKLAAFALIWLGIAVFSIDSLRAARRVTA